MKILINPFQIWWKWDQIWWKWVKIWWNLMKIHDIGSKNMILWSKKWFSWSRNGFLGSKMQLKKNVENFLKFIFFPKFDFWPGIHFQWSWGLKTPKMKKNSQKQNLKILLKFPNLLGHLFGNSIIWKIL